MTDIVLSDIDPVLAERIRQVSEARGWQLPQALQWLLEQGLVACERGAAVNLEAFEADALQEALAAMEQVPSDPGFALIGRGVKTPKPRPEDPDQSVNTGFSLK